MESQSDMEVSLVLGGKWLTRSAMRSVADPETAVRYGMKVREIARSRCLEKAFARKLGTCREISALNSVTMFM